jgi:nucleoid DNA-binding protein
MLPERTTEKLAALNEEEAGRIPQTEEVLNLIVRTMKRHAHRSISRATAKLLYEAIIEHMMATTAKKGYFRLPSGWGSFYLKVLGVGAKPRRLPNGETVPRQPKSMVRYQQGAIVRQMFGTQTPAEYRRSKPRKSAVDTAVGEGFDLSSPDLNATEEPSV